MHNAQANTISTNLPWSGRGVVLLKEVAARSETSAQTDGDKSVEAGGRRRREQPGKSHACFRNKTNLETTKNCHGHTHLAVSRQL